MKINKLEKAIFKAIIKELKENIANIADFLKMILNLMMNIKRPCQNVNQNSGEMNNIHEMQDVFI